MRGLNTSTSSKRAKCAAAMCSCLGWLRTQNQARALSALAATPLALLGYNADDMRTKYAPTVIGRRKSYSSANYFRAETLPPLISRTSQDWVEKWKNSCQL